MIITKDKLGAIRKRYSNKKIVFTLGCFDLFHVGHLRYLERAKKFGDVLVVNVATDERVKLLKGKGRPVINAKQRTAIINSLQCVNYTICYPTKETDPAIEIIKRLKPDVFITINDKRDEILRVLLPKLKIIKLSETKNISTTQLISKI